MNLEDNLENENPELKLAKDVLISINKREHKDRVRMFYNSYLSYLQKNGLDFDEKLFRSVDDKYMRYIRGDKKYSDDIGY